MSVIHVKEFIIDEQGNRKSVIIDIDEYHRIERILPAVDPDAEIFESRKNEEAIPIEDCDDILKWIDKDHRVLYEVDSNKDSLNIVAIRHKNERTYK